jgi:hypothetical protein
MIISKKHNFTFIHIPKCAGTTVRTVLSEFNEWKHSGPPWVKNHSYCGLMDFGHIPLFTLRDHFKNDFEAIKASWSFAVVRDPHERFASSVSQRLKMYNENSIYSLSTKDFERVIKKDIEFLINQPKTENLLPAEYIHFQKQSDYLKIEGEMLVDSIYTTGNLSELFEEIEKITGKKLSYRSDKSQDVRKEGETRVIKRDSLIWLVKAGKMFGLNKIISSNIKQRILGPISTPRDQRLKSLFMEPYVKNFISDYYQDDIEIYKSATQKK